VRAVVRALRKSGAAKIVVAAPVAPPDVVQSLRGEADDVVCLAEPDPFYAVGLWYRDFAQTSDQDVVDLMSAVR
jgi:putative phosphoribosyl transferase